ncbi:hypothetical protein EV360DRAFT_75145 [Lentinula raphanica]|nr:hypothetical protein EV360DRAFT_75145 [Lentinula raphanica]
MPGSQTSSSSVDAGNTSASRPHSDVMLYQWFHRGFVEGLKRARAPSLADETFEALAYDLSETRVHLEETQAKLSDTTESFRDVQTYLKYHMNPGLGGAFNATGSSARTSGLGSPLHQLEPGALNTHSELSPPSHEVNTDHQQPAWSSRCHTQPWRHPSTRPIRREFVELARASIPGYYSTSASELVSHSVDNALGNLFGTAQAGNEQSIALVKALCREAHATQPERKTYGQRRILRDWRNPFNHSQPSPISGSQPIHVVNPQRNDPPAVWVEYYTRYPKSLPRGVRVNPRTGAPFLEDVTASRLLARLRPTSSLYRTEFNIAMTKLFITKGQYAEFIRDGVVQIPQPTVDYQPFDPGCSRKEPINIVEVAQHYSKCGVSIETVETNVEFWVVEYMKQTRFE